MCKFLTKIFGKVNENLLYGYVLGLATAMLVVTLKSGYYGRMTKLFFISNLVISLVSFIVVGIFYKDTKKDFSK